MNQPEIAAIICTHNRDNYLGLAIDSLLQQEYNNYEIIVIDNASTDSTKEVVKVRLNQGKIRYVYEAQLGLSVARNRGFAETNAPIIAYLDDDAIASPHWLEKIVTSYTKNSRLAIAGGKVDLIWPPGVTQPRWISENLAGALGLYDLGEELKLITNPNLTPRGLNYTVRRSFLEEVGGFDLNLGRVGKKLLSNEELYMTQLAIQKGWQVAYLPEALVSHHVSPERLEADWFLRRSWWQGISEYYREEAEERVGFGQLLRGSERLVRGLYKAGKYIQNPALRFDNLTYAYGQIGYLKVVIENILKINRK